jgi:hypothetical protein
MLKVTHDDRTVEVPREVLVQGDEAVKAYLDEHLYNETAKPVDTPEETD